MFWSLLFFREPWWFPSIYDTTHVVNDWASFKVQLNQMIMPVMVLALQITAQISRFMRASMLDNLNQDYVRTARAKDWANAWLSWCMSAQFDDPVVTVIALAFHPFLAAPLLPNRCLR